MLVSGERIVCYEATILLQLLAAPRESTFCGLLACVCRTHPHRDAEIFSYVVDGYLSHKDSMGNMEALPRGSVQYLSAGTGISHSVSLVLYPINGQRQDTLCILLLRAVTACGLRSGHHE